jgi:hypothetical protein
MTNPLLACAYGEVARLENDWAKAKESGQQQGSLKITMDWYKPSKAAAHAGTSTKEKIRPNSQALARATPHTASEHAEGTTQSTIRNSKVIRTSPTDRYAEADRPRTRRREPARTTVRVTVRQEHRAESARNKRNSVRKKSLTTIVPLTEGAPGQRNTTVQCIKPPKKATHWAPTLPNSKRRRAKSSSQAPLPPAKATMMPSAWYPSYHPATTTMSKHRGVEQPPVFRTVHWGAPRTTQTGAPPTLSSHSRDVNQRDLYQWSRRKPDKPASSKMHQRTSMVPAQTKKRSLAVSKTTKQMSPLLSTGDSPTATQSDPSIPARGEDMALTLALRPSRPRSPSRPRPRRKSTGVCTTTFVEVADQRMNQPPLRQRRQQRHSGSKHDPVDTRPGGPHAEKKRSRQQTESEADMSVIPANPGTIVKKVRYEVDSSGRIKQMPTATASMAAHPGTAAGVDDIKGREGQAAPAVKVTRYRYHVV